MPRGSGGRGRVWKRNLIDLIRDFRGRAPRQPRVELSIRWDCMYVVYFEVTQNIEVDVQAILADKLYYTFEY